MSTETVQKRVAAGAAMLDREMPGWQAEVDVAMLDAAHQNRCVLGQLFGRYAFAPVDGLAAVAHGFKATSADEVAALTGEWRRAIEARRVDVGPAADTYAGIPVRRNLWTCDNWQRMAEDLMAFQDAVQESLRTEEAGHVLDAIAGLKEDAAGDRWHTAVLRRHMAAHGLEDPTWANLSEANKAILRARDDEVLAGSLRRLPTGMDAA